MAGPAIPPKTALSLSEHERSGAIGMLKARYHNYSASEIATRLLGQLKVEAGLVSQEWRPAFSGNLRRLCIDDIYIDDICSGRLLSVPDD